MLDKEHFVTGEIYNAKGRMANFLTMKGLLDQKAASNLRLLATKNNINRMSDYHYLNLAVTQSTEPVNGIDYIHPIVKPVVDYCTSVIIKGLSPNGEISFEFVADAADDTTAARQASEMVSKIVNQQNEPHTILYHWIMDAALHKNGEMLISPVREAITRYVTITGTMSQLQAYESTAADNGLTAQRQSRRRVSVNLDAVFNETTQGIADLARTDKEERLKAYIASFRPEEDPIDESVGQREDYVNAVPEDADSLLNESIGRNTIYEAKYKLTGYNLKIQFRPIAQHYWMCNPTIINIQDQDFCGFYDPMSVAEATERYPGIDLAKFEKYAEYSNVGAYQAGSLLNNLALHARDSVPINGLPASGYAAQDGAARQVTVLTVWNRYDIDGDGELELIETIYSGQYVISTKEVEFIPVANMCPKPLAQNFYGMSIAESVVPMQEYATSGHRAEIQLGLLTATPRYGVKPDRVDFEMLQDGEAAIFVLDSKFDPSTDVWSLPVPNGNINFIETAMTRLQQDTMAMVGMTTPQDTFNPEVMAPGNSGYKLQLALSPNQIIQDNTVKNCAEGLKEAIWLVWRTLVQYSEDYGVKKLAASCHPDRLPIFLDGQRFDELNFFERDAMHLDLALGMLSEENQLQRLQIIKQAQQQLMTELQTLLSAGIVDPAIIKKVKKPYEDTLYSLGVKDCDTYLPTDEEIGRMIKQAEQARQQRGPSADDQAKLAKAHLDEARAQEIALDVQGQTADKQLEAVSLIQEHKAARY